MPRQLQGGGEGLLNSQKCRSSFSIISTNRRNARTYSDNQLALNAGWDDELLRIELAALRSEDFNLDLIGFNVHELDELLRDPMDEEKGKEVKKLAGREGFHFAY